MMRTRTTCSRSSAPTLGTSSTRRPGHLQSDWHWRIALPCFVALFLRTGVAEKLVVTSSASLETKSDNVWLGESVLMRCVATPKYAGISKVLWMRRENDGTMRNIYLDNLEHPQATGPYEQFIGRIKGWLKVDEGTHYLNLTRTMMSDTAEYYCIVTDDNYLDMISPAKQITVNVKHFNHSIRVNGSSENLSGCDEVTLDSSSGVDEEVKITCSVTAAPKPRLRWRVTDTTVREQPEEHCSAYNNSTRIHTCTSTTTRKLRELTSQRTEIRCEARYEEEALIHMSEACVTLVYENFSPPPSALTAAMTGWPVIVVVVIAVLVVVSLLIILAIIFTRRRRSQERDKHLQNSSKPMLRP